MKVLLIVGVLLPFLVAAGLLAALMSGVDLSDGVAFRAAYADMLGFPAVGVALYRWLPLGWPEERRVAVAVLLTMPLFSAEAFLALLMFAVGMYSLGLAPA